MDHFQYRDGDLYCEDVAVRDIAAHVGTPAYVYSQRTLEEHYRGFAAAFGALQPLILYSVKSCGNLSLLKLLVANGAGMDVVSGGELSRALQAGAQPSRIVFAGVGKTEAEIRYALSVQTGWLNVESEAELEAVSRIARELGCVANVAIRLNPDVIDPRTHQHTATGGMGSKFGVDTDRVEPAFARFSRDPHVSLSGLHFHLGSPIYSAQPYVRAIERVSALMERLAAQGHRVHTLDIGGGFMAQYDAAETATPWSEYAGPIVNALQPFVASGGQVMIEPGRTISANAGILLSRVLYRKRAGQKEIAVIDTGMHHFIRPALYDAEQFIWPAHVSPNFVPPSRALDANIDGLLECDIAGPICESTDYLARARRLPPLHRADLLAIYSAGAYGMVMASQYNAVPRPPEVLVEGGAYRVIRRRETYEDLVSCETEFLRT